MKKFAFLTVGLFYVYAFAGINTAYSFSIIKPENSSELLNYNKGSEFIKLSFKQFTLLTGAKENLLNKLSFNIIKIRVKHDLKKNPGVKLTDYYTSKHRTPVVLKVFSWIVLLLLVLLLIFALLFSGARK